MKHNALQRIATQRNATQKKFIKSKRNSTKRKLMGGMYEEQEIPEKDSDVLFQDNDVCVLKPDSPRGILIFSRVRLDRSKYKTDKEFEDAKLNVCSEGIYSHRELRKKKPELQLNDRGTYDDHNDLIFFRAPFNSDIHTFETAYECSPSDLNFKKENHIITVLLRIDPEKTFVYSSEIRAKKPEEIKGSRKPMMEYLQIIEQNKELQRLPNTKLRANLLTYKQSYVPNSFHSLFPFLDYWPINRNTEVVVKIPHIPAEWLAGCITEHTRKN